MKNKGNKFTLSTWMKSLIPGIIIAAVVFGPSKMTITSKLGATYGYSLVWIVPIAIFFMAIFTGMGSRIGMHNVQSLIQLIRNKFGRWAVLCVGIGIFSVAASFQAGNAIGVGISLAEPTKTSPQLWIIAFTIMGISLLFFSSFYRVLERLMLFLVLLMFLSFTITLILAKPNLELLAAGAIPSLPEGSEGLIIAFMASCFSIVGAFYQSYLVQERKKTRATGAYQDKSLIGIIMLGVMSMIVMICSASILHPKQIQLISAMDMANVLQPLFGGYASGVFLTGLFAASFSSLVGNATVGGSLLADALGFKQGMDTLGSRICIALVMLIGASVAILFGGLPLQLIVLAQSITIFLVPFIGYMMFSVANDSSIMKDNRNSQFQKISGFVGLLCLTGLAVYNFYNMFIK
ncbi:divalent metal cation transporter [Sphingobacterium alkalisoli]|uniref:Divalent metal cation transporter n=1 Tax=Sphingobacterium alkalisoli TaxID=1874115 RepID=A0A4U0GXZ9_9SPHI|nr:Nramp family divalent metal transporter [Sphingobacterium alkalisoli]TJY62732.1 divalent metal cation transporter [Sphingobacterium alkalisoli]GGH28526.1 manganese transporter [Sphingobacterium alkalisoli]